MIRVATTKSNTNSVSIVKRIIATGEVSRQQHLQLTSALLSNNSLSDSDRRQINRVFDYLRNGRLKLVD